MNRESAMHRWQGDDPMIWSFPRFCFDGKILKIWEWRFVLLVTGTMEFGLTFQKQLGMLSSQLTNSIIFRGVGIPPNQYCNWYVTHKPNKISMDEMDQAEQFGISNLMNYIGCYRMNWYWYSKPSNKFRGRFQSPVSTMHFWQEWR